jgi:hypothetical protein
MVVIYLKKLLSFIFILILLLPSCGTQHEYVLKLENRTIEPEIYGYFLSAYKARLYENRVLSSANLADVWDSVTDSGKTVYEEATETADILIKTILVSAYLADFYRITLPSATLDAIDSEIADVLEYRAGGDKAEFKALLAEFDLTETQLKEAYKLYDLSDFVYDYIIDKNIVTQPTELEIDRYYKDNYVHIDSFYIAVNRKPNLNADGSPIYDENGSYLVDISESERAEKSALADKINSELTAENFSEYKTRYNEDSAGGAYPNGMYLYKGMQYPAAVVNAAFAADMDSVTSVETADGIFLIKKLPLAEQAYTDTANADFFADLEGAALAYKFNNFMDEYRSMIVVNEELAKEYDIRTIEPCFDF